MILGSTVGAVAAVLSYHPAASGEAAPITNNPETPSAPSTATPEPSAPATPVTPAPAPTPDLTASATPTATALPTPKATVKKKSSATKSSSSSGSANITPDPTPSASAPATVEPSTPAPKTAKDQTVTGATAQTRWGPVQVQITVKDGKIVDAVGLQYPNGDRRSQYISSQAVPWLVEETLTEQIADVQIIGGATYTSNGWRQSLASAMQKAGL